MKSFREEYLALNKLPSSEWEPYISSLDVQREYFFVESNGVKLEAELFIPNGGEEKKAAVVFAPRTVQKPHPKYFTLEKRPFGLKSPSGQLSG